jgi:hypothetical protein
MQRANGSTMKPATFFNPNRWIFNLPRDVRTEFIAALVASLERRSTGLR